MIGLIAIIIPSALAVGFAMASGGAMVVARQARAERDRAEAREALAWLAKTEAVHALREAEDALAEIRARRSKSVSQGNRTRAQRRAALVRSTTAAIAREVALKRAGGQHSLPLDSGGGA